MERTKRKTRRASSRPLVPGGSNYTAMHLIFQEQTVRVKPSLWCYFFAALLAIPAIIFLVGPVVMFRLFDDTDLMFLLIAAAIFGASVFLIYLAARMVLNGRKRCRAVFDLAAQVFCPQGRGAPAIPFAELDSLQIVEEHCSAGRGSFDSYELNVVLRDGRRFNLLDHGNKECFALEAEKLSSLLGLPLTDAQDQCLTCDDFLSLPVNIRENLLFGLYGFLLFALFFALGDGRSWYLTKQSFSWEKIPAQVESAVVRKHSGRRTTYSLEFRFRYEYQGKKYTGSDYDFFHLRSSQYTLEETVRRYPAGRKFSCYVNPRSPEQAVVDRMIPPVWEMMLNSPWTSCFLIAGLFCLLKAATQYRLLKKRKKQIGDR